MYWVQGKSAGPKENGEIFDEELSRIPIFKWLAEVLHAKSRDDVVSTYKALKEFQLFDVEKLALLDLSVDNIAKMGIDFSCAVLIKLALVGYTTPAPPPQRTNRAFSNASVASASTASSTEDYSCHAAIAQDILDDHQQSVVDIMCHLLLGKEQNFLDHFFGFVTDFKDTVSFEKSIPCIDKLKEMDEGDEQLSYFAANIMGIVEDIMESLQDKLKSDNHVKRQIAFVFSQIGDLMSHAVSEFRKVEYTLDEHISEINLLIGGRLGAQSSILLDTMTTVSTHIDVVLVRAEKARNGYQLGAEILSIEVNVMSWLTATILELNECDELGRGATAIRAQHKFAKAMLMKLRQLKTECELANRKKRIEGAKSTLIALLTNVKSILADVLNGDNESSSSNFAEGDQL